MIDMDKLSDDLMPILNKHGVGIITFVVVERDTSQGYGSLVNVMGTTLHKTDLGDKTEKLTDAVLEAFKKWNDSLPNPEMN